MSIDSTKCSQGSASLAGCLRLWLVLLFAFPLAVQSQTKKEVQDWLKGRGHGSYMFGQMASWVHNEMPDLEHRSNWVKRVHDHTGVMPAYGCLTYDFDDDPFPDSTLNEGVKQMWDRGMLVGVYSFFANPSGGKWNDPVQIDAIFAAEINPVKANFYAQMDRMAANLQWLKEKGVVVVYTPFVELDDRYKWHAKEGPQNGIRLFRLVHDHFTGKGLDNILWAYHTTQNAGALQQFYPGDAYVDIIGKSAYGQGLIFDEYDWAVEKKKKAGKLIWWAELGIRGQKEAPRDCLDVVRKLDERFPELFGFNFWGDGGYFNVIGNQNGKELMMDSRIITLDSKELRMVRPGARSNAAPPKID
jgi:mannan endo-1,4-beta-mannosidase